MATTSEGAGQSTRRLPGAGARAELALQHLLTAWILSGLFFMLLPGTFLGVWNLISISGGRRLEAISPAWIQAHGHAQVFGWVGSFILGIGFYSLSKMAGHAPAGPKAGWVAWVLWTGGVGWRWWAGITNDGWRVALPASALLELIGFLIFFRTVSRHRPAAAGAATARPIWMMLVMLATLGFLAVLVANFALVVRVAARSSMPAIPHLADQRFLTLALWSLLAPVIWGFNARWIPVFVGLPQPSARGLWAAWGLATSAVVVTLANAWLLSGVLATLAAVTASLALHIPRKAVKAAKTTGVHASFPVFARLPYAWLVLASLLAIAAPLADHAGGIWGASRHAMTVGFIAAMVFVIGQRVLPAFCGMRVLFSPRLMFCSLALLNLGCLLRVSMEPLAYEGYWAGAWAVLPVSAVIELAAIVVFAVNLLATLARPPEHVRLGTA